MGPGEVVRTLSPQKDRIGEGETGKLEGQNRLINSWSVTITRKKKYTSEKQNTINNLKWKMKMEVTKRKVLNGRPCAFPIISRCRQQPSVKGDRLRSSLRKALTFQNENIMWLPTTSRSIPASHSSITFWSLRNPCVINDGERGLEKWLGREKTHSSIIR